MNIGWLPIGRFAWLWQVNFRMTSLPVNMGLVGGHRAFILYDRSLFEANDDIRYRHFLRDLEMKRQLTKFFLPETNYALCKLQSKRFTCDQFEFVLIFYSLIRLFTPLFVNEQSRAVLSAVLDKRCCHPANANEIVWFRFIRWRNFFSRRLISLAIRLFNSFIK